MEGEQNERDEIDEVHVSGVQGAVALESTRELPDGLAVEDEGAAMENSILDKIPTRLFHH